MIRRLHSVLVVLLLLAALPVQAMAQDDERSGPPRSFFSTIEGYLGAVEATFQSEDVENDPYLSISATGIKFESEDAAILALETAREAYPERVHASSDDAFDYSGIVRLDDPSLGDEAAAYGGPILSLPDETPAYAYTLIHARVGEMIVAMQGFSTEEVPINTAQRVLGAVIARDHAPTELPIDGSDSDAAIWSWLPTTSDLPGTYVESARLWRDATGTEFDVTQDGESTEESPDFFAAIEGYAGGASSTYTLVEFDPEAIVLISGGAAQYIDEDAAMDAMEIERDDYLDYVHAISDEVYDLTGIELVEAPELGDEISVYAGPAIGSGEDSPDLYLVVVNIRIGSVIFGLQGTTVDGDPLPELIEMLETIIEREPEASPLPIDGDDPDSPIWSWVVTFDDLPGEYTMDERQWSDADGVEYAVDVLEA